MQIGKLQVELDVRPKLNEHFRIRLKNSETAEYFKVDGEDQLEMRLTLETALKLADFIDSEIEALRVEKLGYGMVEQK